MKVLAAKSQEGSEESDAASQATEARPRDVGQRSGTRPARCPARRDFEELRGSQAVHGHQEGDAAASRTPVAVPHPCLARTAGVLPKPVGPGGGYYTERAAG